MAPTLTDKQVNCLFIIRSVVSGTWAEIAKIFNNLNESEVSGDALRSMYSTIDRSKIEERIDCTEWEKVGDSAMLLFMVSRIQLYRSISNVLIGGYRAP
jgi:hypothetical protein